MGSEGRLDGQVPGIFTFTIITKINNNYNLFPFKQKRPNLFRSASAAQIY